MADAAPQAAGGEQQQQEQQEQQEPPGQPEEEQPEQQGYYNPRPAVRHPEPRLEVREVRGLTGARERVRVVFGTEGASSLSSVATLCNSAIGAGVLSLPYAFQCAGLVGCLVLSFVVACSEAFTMYVLAKFAERYGDADSYGTLVRRALGRKTAAVLSGVLLLYLWGSCVAYLVIVADTFTNLSVQHLGPDALPSSRPAVLLATGVVVFIMCLPRELQALENVSFAAVLGFLYTAGAVLVRGLQAARARPDAWSDVSLFEVDMKSLYALSIVVFGFNCHANVVGVFYELEHYPRSLLGLPSRPQDYHQLGPLAPKPYTYKLAGMLGAIASAAALIFTGYMAVGVAGYLAYPLTVSSNVLNSFPADDVAIQIARAVIGCVVIGHWPLNHSPARKAWEDLLDVAADVKSVPGWASVLLTAVFVAGSVGTALLVTDLGSVLHVIGGTAAAFMIYALPGMLCLNAAIIKHTMSTTNLSQMDEEGGEEADDVSPPASTTGATAGGDDDASLRSAPLLGKKAGIREAGLLFVPGKSWGIGLALVIVSAGVLGITLLTLAFD